MGSMRQRLDDLSIAYTLLMSSNTRQRSCRGESTRIIKMYAYKNNGI